MLSKICTKCKDDKPIDMFYKCKGNNDGFAYYCKKCAKDYQSNWKSKNISRVKKTQEEYRKNNRESKNKASRDYYHKNKEYHVKYRADNIERTREYYRQYKKKRYATDAMFNVRQRLSSVIKTCLKRRGYSKTSKSAEILGTDYDTVWAHLQQTWFDKYGAMLQITDKYHIHHIIFCSTANTEEELVELQHYKNLTLLTPEDHKALHKEFGK